MNINSWDDTWGTINWADSEDKIVQKIKDFYQAGVDFNMRNRNDEDETPIFYAAEYSKIDAIEWLIDGGADINLALADNWTPLHYAARDDRRQTVKALIENGAKVNTFCNITDIGLKTPLMLAARNNNIEIVRLLVKAGADVTMQDNEGKTALHIVTEKNYPEIAKELITGDKGCLDVQNKSGWTALMYAVRDGKEELVKLLIKAGTNVNIRSSNGLTALYLAAFNNHIKYAYLLIKAGADTNIKDDEGKTAVHIAVEKGLPAMVKVLACDASINAKDNAGWTPLMYAVRDNKKDIAKILIEAGANVNIQNDKGWTALHLATWNNHTKIAQMLIGFGADVKIKNLKGSTPFDISDNKQIDGFIKNAPQIRAACVIKHPHTVVKRFVKSLTIGRQRV